MKTSHPASKWLLALVIFINLLYLTTGTIYAEQLAFPSAEGFGRYSVGGRGGQVVEVTNLDDSGPGSLRAAIDTIGPRIVVFRVSGNIELLSELKIDDPYITIAGQTAPGDGICIKNYRLRIMADHVIIRYIRVRLGDAKRVPTDTVWIATGHNIILDHCSASWAVDETISAAANITNESVLGDVTVQWCFITESLNGSVHDESRYHGYGSLNRGGWGNGYTFHHNLYAHHKGRNPYAGNYNSYAIDPDGLIFDFRNNVVYNWSNYAGHNADFNSITKMNFVGNYYQRGPDSPASNYAFWQQKVNLYNRMYFSGNMMNGNYPADQWSLVKFDDGYTEAQKAAYKLANPVPVPPVQTDDAVTAYGMVLADAGASFPVRDAVDERDVDNVMNLTGQIINCVECNDFYYPSGYAQGATSNTITITYDYVEDDDRFTGMEIEILAGTGVGQKRLISDYIAATNLATVSTDWDVIPDVTSLFGIIVDCDKNAGGYPVLHSGTPPVDTDHDGMPDYWEWALCLDPNDSNDSSGDRDGDGYTNIEEYINWLPLGEPMPEHLDSDGDGKGDACDECPFDPIDGCVNDGDVIFVDEAAMGVNDGSNWQDAYTSLQDALAAAVAGKNIAVAQGTYKPAQVDRTSTFQLISGVGIYGGYPTGGGPWISRSPNTYQTILSGDLNGNDAVIDFNNPYDLIMNPSRIENSYHVVIGSNTEANAILDGFIITAGNANSGSWPDDYGGGMFNINANCTVNNCTFFANCGGGGGIGSGGAMFNSQSNLHISNCIFFRNAGGYGGGGILFYDSNNPAVVNCSFISNSGFLLGNNGGGLYNMQNSNPLVMNCQFIHNFAMYGGAVSNIHGSSPTITNCDFIYNFADESCGGINDYNNSNPTITNCILWDNSPPQISDFLNCAAIVTYSDVQGGWPGTGNINADPLFVDADGPDNIVGTEDDDLRLTLISPCVDAGDNNSVPSDYADLDSDANKTEPTPLDLDYRPRFTDGDCNGTVIVDMGAFEFSYAYFGDFDSDCDVDFIDFAIQANFWLTDELLADIAPTPAGDGLVDTSDLAVLCDNWLESF